MGFKGPKDLRSIAYLAAALVLLAVPPTQGREEVREHPTPVMGVSPPNPTLVVGERLSFHGRWFGIPVGHGWIEVKELLEIDGRPAYHIEAQGHSNDFLATFYPVHDVLHSYLEPASLRPIRIEKVQREGDYRADEVVTFDYDRLTATYRSLLNQSAKEIPIPPNALDLLGAFYWLRTHLIEPGPDVSLQVYSDEKVYQTQIKRIKSLQLELLWRGTFPCVLLEPVAAFKGVFIRRGRVWVYMSLDARRLPLLVKVTTPWGPITGLIDPDAIHTLIPHDPHAVGHPASP